MHWWAVLHSVAVCLQQALYDFRSLRHESKMMADLCSIYFSLKKSQC